MAENFNLIFGSQAPTTASWSDADYQTGWNVVGSTPPTAEQFDALQNRADKKAQELNNRILPLEQKAEEQGRQASTAYTVGAAVTVDGLPADWLLICTTAGISGTVAITLPAPLLDGATINDGTITWTLRKIATNGSLGYRQPSTAYAVGNIAYHSALPTGWYLECTTAGTTSSGDLTISSPSIGGTVSDGTVVWTINSSLHLIGGGALTGSALTINGNDIAGSAIVAKSLDKNGYIKYASGLIIQWGSYDLPFGTSATGYTLTVPFSVSFATNYYHQVICNHTTDSTNNHTAVTMLNGAQYNGPDKFTVRLKLLSEATDPVIYGGIDWFAIGY
jgi:hypothetical protein